MKSKWRKVTDVPQKPVSALLAFIADDGEGILTGSTAFNKEGVFVGETTGKVVSSELFWLDEDLLFKAFPLRVKAK